MKKVGPRSTCERVLLRRWWRSIGLMVFYDFYSVSPEYFGYTLACGKWYLLYFWVDCQRAARWQSTQKYNKCRLSHTYLLMMGCWYVWNT
jgi:hypothetical protein